MKRSLRDRISQLRTRLQKEKSTPINADQSRIQRELDYSKRVGRAGSKSRQRKRRSYGR